MLLTSPRVLVSVYLKMDQTTRAAYWKTTADSLQMKEVDDPVSGTVIIQPSSFRITYSL